MILTVDDFNLIPYNLPDQSGVDGATNTFEKYLEAQIEDILRKLLGHEMYDEFAAALELEPYLLEPRWANLLDGAYYTWNEKKYKWYGMKKMLIPYIAAMWNRHTIKKHGVNGYYLVDIEHGKRTDVMYEISAQYNDFAKKAGSKFCYYDSLYGYLKTRSPEFATTTPDFTNWVYQDQGYMNEYDL